MCHVWESEDSTSDIIRRGKKGKSYFYYSHKNVLNQRNIRIWMYERKTGQKWNRDAVTTDISLFCDSKKEWVATTSLSHWFKHGERDFNKMNKTLAKKKNTCSMQVCKKSPQFITNHNTELSLFGNRLTLHKARSAETPHFRFFEMICQVFDTNKL